MNEKQIEREYIISELRKYRAMPLPGNGKSKYPIELRSRAVKAIEKGVFETAKELATLVKIGANLLSKWKSDMYGKVEARAVNHGKSGVRYAISTKIDAVNQVLEQGRAVSQVAKALNTSTQSIGKWIKDYQDGLYIIENVTQISRKKFTSSEILLGQLDTMQTQMNNKKIEVREALEREYKEKLSRLD